MSNEILKYISQVGFLATAPNVPQIEDSNANWSPLAVLNSVANAAALAAFPTVALADGFLVYVNTFRTYFVFYGAGTATVDGITTIAGLNGGQWQRLAIAHPSWMLQLNWYADSVNGNDENIGDSTHPIKTDDERVRRMGGTNAVWNAGAYHLYYMGSDLPTIKILGQRNVNTVSGINTTIFLHGGSSAGVGKAILYSGTIDALTAANYIAQPWQLTSNAIPASWTASGLINSRGRITSGTVIGARFWPVVDIGGKAAYLSEPFAAASYTVPYTTIQALAVPTVGNTFVIESLTVCTELIVALDNGIGFANTAGVVAEGFEFTRFAINTTDRVVLDGSILVSSSGCFIGSFFITSSQNKMTSGLGRPIGCDSLSVVGGYANGGATGCDYVAINSIVVRDYMQVATRTKWSCAGSTEGGARLTTKYACINCTTAGANINVNDKLQIEGAAVIWGLGSTVPIFKVYRGCQLNFANQPVAANVTLTTTATTDIAFADKSVASPFNPATGLYTVPAIPITMANLLAAAPAGFGLEVNDPMTGCTVGRTV